MQNQPSADSSTERRFREILAHAWHRSPLYREIYTAHGIREADLAHITLEELPTVSKDDVMARFDEAVTDPRLRKAELEEWAVRDPNPLSLYLGEYIIVYSSGGSPINSYVPYTRRAWRYMTATVAPTLLPTVRQPDERLRSAFYFSGTGHFAGATNAHFASQAGHETLHVSVFDPVEEVRARLNAFQPQRIYTYASALSWLVEWALAGTLKIAPTSVLVSSDRLSHGVRAAVEKLWGAEIYDLYAACESLFMAVRRPGCDEYEVFTDLNRLEVTDSAGRMVKPGERGRVLLTSLIHTVLPLLRFDLTDSAVVGRVGDGVETLARLDGKISNSLPVTKSDGSVAALEVHELTQLELPGVYSVQVVRHGPQAVEIRYQSEHDLDTQIGDTFHRLLAQKSASMREVSVRRVERILYDARTFKRWLVIDADRPVFGPVSLEAEVGGSHGPSLPHLSTGYFPFSPTDREASIGGRFEAVAAKHGDRCAVIDGERQMTYTELERLSALAAGALLRRRFDAARPVAVMCGKRLDAIPLVLGVLRAGGFYLPLDPHLPAARLRTILEQTRPQLLLTDATGRDAALADGRITVLCPGEQETDTHPIAPPTVAPEAPACLLYTSGTTGAPKGIILSHAAILQRTARYVEDFRIGAEDRISLVQSATTNAGVRDIFGALLTGAALALYDVFAQGFSSLAAWLNTNRITIFYAVPTVFRLFLETLTDETFPTVRAVRLGGESLREGDVVGFRRFFAPGCRLVNGYASTETGTVSLYWMDHDTRLVAGRIPGGYPIPSAQVTLVDDAGQPVAHTVGEVMADGPMLASGYWDAENRKMIPLARPFATGDFGFRLDDGRIFLTGRRDAVVNLHGVRIHLGEVEAAVCRMNGVAEAVVVARRAAGGDDTLVVYYVAKDAEKVTTSELRRVLASALPAQALPTAFVALDALPRLPGGKVNRDALRDEPVYTPERPLHAEPRYDNEVEERVAGIWQEVLGLRGIDRQADFFDLGGDSVAVFRVLSRIQAEFAVELTVAEYFEHSTVAGLSRMILLRE